MNFSDFKKSALITLIGNQRDNGSWLNDEAATCAAMEALLEEHLGPRPFCRRSWLYKHAHPSSHSISSWPLMFSYGMPLHGEEGSFDAVSTVFKGFSIGESSKWYKSSNLWMMAKWLRLFSMTDPDCWPDHFPDSLYSYPS